MKNTPLGMNSVIYLLSCSQSLSRTTTDLRAHKYHQSPADRRPPSPALTRTGSIPHTHSTANERGSPKITTLPAPGATSDFMSAAAPLIYSTLSASTASPEHPTPLPIHNTTHPPTHHYPHILPLFSSESLPPSERQPSSAPEPLAECVALSARDNGGHTQTP